MARGQKKGFKHSPETIEAIRRSSKERYAKQGIGGFNVRVSCDNCQQEMSPANLPRHYERCLIYKGRIKKVKTLRRQLRPYGLSVEQFEQMLVEQDGRCYICHRAPDNSARFKRLSVDHNHVTNQVRKLLCTRCNLTLGKVEESVELLKRMIAYLDEHNEQIAA